MKYLIIVVLSFLLSGCFDEPVGKNGLTTIQAEASKQAVVSDPLVKDRAIDNNVNEVLGGCTLAKEIESIASNKYIITGTKTDLSNGYNCQEENNPIPQPAGETIGTIESRINWVIGGVAGVLMAIIAIQKVLAIMGWNLKRVNNTPITFLKSLFEFCIIFFLFSILLLILKIGLGWSGVAIKMDSDSAMLKETAQVIPDFSYKNERLANILDYLICVKSTAVQYSDQSAAISISKVVNGRMLSASYGQCKLQGGYALDTKGIAVAKKYNLGDYTQIQDDAVEKALSKFIADADKVAAKYSVGLTPVILKGVFNEKTASCSVDALTSIDTRYFPARDLEKYKAFALNCLSRNFVFDLTKTHSITMESIDRQQASQGHRRNFICSGGYEPKSVVSLDNIKQLYQQCVSENCNGSSSPYACGTALNGYSMLMDDKAKSFFTLPANDVRRKTFDNASAETLINTFNADFSVMEKREYYDSVGAEIATFPVNTTKGTNTLNQLTNAFRIGYEMKKEGMGGFGIDTILGRFTGRDGLAGSTKFITCMQHPNVMYNGFDCGNVYQEMHQFGIKLTILGTQLKLAGSLNNSHSFKKQMQSADASFTSMKKMMMSFMSVGTAKKFIAWGLPALTDVSGSLVSFAANDNGFAEDFHSVTNTYSEFYLFMFISQLNDDAADLVMKLANAMTALGQLFIFLLPLSDYLIFFAILSGLLFELVFNSVTYKIRWLINLDAKVERKDLDRIAIVLYAEKLIFAALNATLGFLLIPHVFATTFKVVIGDLNDFSLSLFGWSESLRAIALSVIMSIMVIFIIYKITSKLMEMTSGFQEGYMHGTVTKQDMRVQGEREAKSLIKSYKGSIAT
ncbi:hypothetical protein [Pseudomonas putida]|nr:hypothetical protein [Pseudomonas putida]